jgi:Cys-rich protein (TIGR01571 family)
MMLNDSKRLYPQVFISYQGIQWHDSLYHFYHNILPSCIISLLFPYILLGQIAQSIHCTQCPFIVFLFLGYVLILAYILPLSSLVFFLSLWIGISLLIWIIRLQFRRRKNISGDWLNDCIVSFFCQSCVISQMARHLYRYREVFDEIPCGKNGWPSYITSEQIEPSQRPPSPSQVMINQPLPGYEVLESVHESSEQMNPFVIQSSSQDSNQV